MSKNACIWRIHTLRLQIQSKTNVLPFLVGNTKYESEHLKYNAHPEIPIDYHVFLTFLECG